jgi:hypothetical protein
MTMLHCPPWTLRSLSPGLTVAAAAALLVACGDDGTSSTTTSMMVTPTNLVTDAANQPATTDPNPVNPWGMALGRATPFWIADKRTGLSTLYNGAGMPFPPGQALVVTAFRALRPAMN